MIQLIPQNIEIPLIVGGGIVDLHGIQKADDSGADLVLIGITFEKDINFFSPHTSVSELVKQTPSRRGNLNF